MVAGKGRALIKSDRVSDRVRPLIIHAQDPLKNAITIIDENQYFGLAIVVDNNGKFVGLLTSGDIYRAIFVGRQLDAKVREICNQNAITLNTSDFNTRSIIRKKSKILLEKKGKCIPILNDTSEVIDVICINELEEHLTNISNNSPTKSRVLVVGGAGYLGTVLTRRLLDSGYKVRIIDYFKHQNFAIYDLENQENLEILQGDIRDIREIVTVLEGVRSVIHLAAVVGDPAGSNNPKETIEINYLASKMIAEAAKYASVSRFIFASTCSVYGTGNAELSETAPLNPLSHYARTKIAAEQAILSMNSDDFTPTILRMATLYGLSPRMRFDLVVNIFSHKAIREKSIEVFGGEQWRPLLNIEDAAQAFQRVLEVPIEKIQNQVFNVGFEEHNYQIRAVAEMVKDVYPSTKIKVLKDHSNLDERDYKVIFEKIRKVLDFKPEHDILHSIKEIGEFVENNPHEDYSSSKYTNFSLQY